MTGSFLKPVYADILHAICVALGEPIGLEAREMGDYERDREKSARKALLSFALASRTCYHLAVDELWKKLDSLDPLLNILDYKRVSVTTSQLEYVADSPQRWERFEWYAKHVKSVRFQDQDARLPHSILDHSPLLPNLRILYWSAGPLGLADRFFAAQLRQFEINIYDDDETWPTRISSSLNSLATSKAPIERLGLDECNTTISARLLNFPHLVHLTIPYSSVSLYNVMRNISLLPSLKRLELAWGIDDVEDKMIIIPSKPGLRSLTVELLGEWDRMTAVVNALPEQEVESIDIEFRWSAEPEGAGACWDECHELMTLLGTRFSRSLRRFKLRQYPDNFAEDMDHEHGIIEGHFVEPLKAFTNLEDLWLKFSSLQDSYLDDNDIAGLAYAMPNLRKFIIDLDGANTCLTPMSLETLATFCPKLELVGTEVVLEDVVEDYTPAPADVPITSNALKELHVRLSAKPAPARPFAGTLFDNGAPARHPKNDTFAHILDRLFPNLQKVETQPEWDLWTPLLVRKAARREERERLETERASAAPG